ncbi:MAG: MtrB/PioB family decaheme-associated outer membrane protein [Burkholderiaceae bacterium]
MKTHDGNCARRVLAVAIQGALAAMFAAPLGAYAQTDADDDAAALKHPVSTVEVGVMNVAPGSTEKFGEYNGLDKGNAYPIANFNVRGGNAYLDPNGTMRWGMSGTDLGTTSRELGADVADQGLWNLGLRYDELRHTISNTYQTPFQGSMGGNSFTLPSTFGVINTTAVTGSNSQLVGTRNLTAAQQAAFQTQDVGTTRKNSTFSAGYILSRQWNFQFEYNHLDQSGAKLISGSSSDARTGNGAAGTWAKEAMVTLMNPTNYKTDMFNLSANWTGEKAHMTASLVGSYFRDGYNSVSWMSPMGTGSAATGITSTTLAGGYQMNMLSTMPSNDFNQLNLTGGYALSPTTKLAGGLSYGRNTQNDNYLVDMMQAGGLPRNSLNGIVVTKNANLKLTDLSFKDLALTAGFKVNERDNYSPSNVYQMFDIGGGPGSALAPTAANSSTRRTEINTPYSNRKTEIELAGDYKLDKQQSVRLAYDYENIRKWCNGVAGALAPNPAVVGAIAGNVDSPANADCVIVTASAENKLGVNYKFKASDELKLNAGYSYARRMASFDHNALTPLNDQAGANGTGIVNASNYKGYNAFFDTSRIQEAVKAGANWQAAERLNFAVNAKHTRDRYLDGALGVQNGYSTSLNMDAAYGYSESGTISAYASLQQRERNMISGASGLGATDNATNYSALVAPQNIWSNRLTDSDQIIGLNLVQKGLMHNKLELLGDLSLSVGRTKYHTDVPYYVPTATGPSCSSPTVLSCGDTPEIYSKTVQLKVAAKYQLDKKSKVVFGYLFQKLSTNDYYYNVYQYGYSSSTMLPTNQQSPNYTVNLFAATYVYTF